MLILPFNGATVDGVQLMVYGLPAVRVSEPGLEGSGLVTTSKPAVWARAEEAAARAKRAKENCMFTVVLRGLYVYRSSKE